MNDRRVVVSAMFILKEGVTDDQFIPAFTAFYDHLMKAGYARGYRLMRRGALPGFGKKLMPFDFHAELDFPDLATERACYEYVATRAEPMHSLHVTMRTCVIPGSADFFLGTTVASR